MQGRCKGRQSLLGEAYGSRGRSQSKGKKGVEEVTFESKKVFGCQKNTVYLRRDMVKNGKRGVRMRKSENIKKGNKRAKSQARSKVDKSGKIVLYPPSMPGVLPDMPRSPRVSNVHGGHLHLKPANLFICTSPPHVSPTHRHIFRWQRRRVPIRGLVSKW
jgi:hypothetical protein